jgi:hypothetical protein
VLPPTHQKANTAVLFPFSLSRFPLFVQCCHISRQRPSTQHGHGFPHFFLSLFLPTSPQRMYQPPLIMRLLFCSSFEALANTQEEEKKLVLFSFSFWTASALDGAQGRTAWRGSGLKMECMSITAILEEGRVSSGDPFGWHSVCLFLLLFRRRG